MGLIPQPQLNISEAERLICKMKFFTALMYQYFAEQLSINSAIRSEKLKEAEQAHICCKKAETPAVSEAGAFLSKLLRGGRLSSPFPHNKESP